MNRYYDPTTGRYLQTDPLAQYMPGVNPYVYAMNNPVLLIDPTGLEWEYSQSTGQLSHDGVPVGAGYAGNGAGLNNPAMQNQQNVGPLPQGSYTIGQQQDNGHLIESMRLTPAQDNNMFNRNGFLIHGPHANDQQDSSNGCIILNRATRDRIGDSGDNSLRVAP